MNAQRQTALVDSGVPGLDEVIRGGYLPGRFYLIEGESGVGKTTLALQFLLAGVKHGASCMLVTLSESATELRDSAATHDWTLDGIHIVELIASEESLTPDARYTMFHPSEMELAQTTKTVIEEARRHKPTRIVIDSLSELRLLADSPLRYRRQVTALKQHFVKQGATVLVIDDQRRGDFDTYVHSIAQGVIQLESLAVDYGKPRRRLMVKKLRGCSFREGYHDFAILKGGVTVYPRLVAAEHRSPYRREMVKSGVDQLDSLLGGGVSKGTSTMILGPAGSGKSTLATQYVVETTARNEKAAVFLFDETIATHIERSEGLRLPLQSLVDDDKVHMRQVDPAELSPGEFSHLVRKAVEEFGASTVVIDSLTGYLNAMPSERFMSLHLHELVSYLAERGVTTLVTVTQHGIVSASTHAAIDISYLADTVILLRYYEAIGSIHKAVAVIKKRTGKHERTIRELAFDGQVHVSDPIRNFQGVLTGVPQIVGNVPRQTAEADDDS